MSQHDVLKQKYLLYKRIDPIVVNNKIIILIGTLDFVLQVHHHI